MEITQMAPNTDLLITPVYPSSMTLDEVISVLKAIDRKYPILKPKINVYDANTGKQVTIGYFSH